MRTFKVGDKVKFLNETGGGVVTKIISPLVVNVESEGFEIPTLTKDIVLDYVEDKAGKMFTSENKQESQSVVYDEQQDYLDIPKQARDERIYLSRQGQQKDKGVYLAFIPMDQQWLIGGDYNVYLVNNSEWDLLYSLFLKDQESQMYQGKDYGSVEPKHRYLLAQVQDKELEQWSTGVVQLLFHKDETKQVLQPKSFKIKLRTSKFFKEGCFEDTGFFTEKALLIPIVTIAQMDSFVDIEDEDLDSDKNKQKLEALKQDKQTVEIKPTKEVSFFDKHLVSKHQAEVDLHIEELVDSTKGMDNHDMLSVQMDYFKKCLQKAIELDLDKIIFIHGVGQGVLKHNIEEELDKYAFLHYFPASMQKYGVGATEVLIGKNRK